MTLRLGLSLLLSFLSTSIVAAESYYCPQNHAYINLGMNTEEVIAACGKPIRTQEANQPIFKKIPIQQLVFRRQGAATAFYGVWKLPTGNGGASLEIDTIDNKVRAIRLNGSDSNAASICQGAAIQIGDPVAKVYGACGTPSVINNSFIRQAIPSENKPQIWTYQASSYQPTVSLTFVDSKLQSINQ